MQKTFVCILLLIVIVVSFALKNAQPVWVDFWFWEAESNLSLVIVLSVTFGALASFLLSLPYRARKNREIRKRDEQNAILEREIMQMKNKRRNSEREETKTDS